MYYRVTVRDNGMGMSHQDIPNMLGRVLSGTKYGVQQTRGKFGLGAKMALIWAKMSTGMPVEIRSAQRGRAQLSHYLLSIDIYKNEPVVGLAELLDNPDRWHGAELSLTLEGHWSFYRAKVIKYLREIAVITPYAQFKFQFAAENERNSFVINLVRRTDKMPRPPQEARHHPASVDLELLKRLLEGTKAATMLKFLSKDFDCVSKDLAQRILAELREDEDADPRELPPKQVVRLHQLLHDVKIPNPRGDHLSPAGEYNLRLGVMKELRPDLVATYSGEARALDGHAFLVEAAVSLGGKDVKPGLNIFRFANRIPLLFEAGSDVITRCAMQRITWSAYKINHQSDKVRPCASMHETRRWSGRRSTPTCHNSIQVGVFVSIVSTKIPFKGAGKEYIADDIEELRSAVRQAIQSCCLQLKAKIAKQQAAQQQKNRKKQLVKYIPNVCSSVFRVLEEMGVHPPRGPKRQRLDAEHGILGKLRSPADVSEEVLVRRLEEHVERMDTENALEYHLQQGLAEGAATDLFLVPRSEAVHRYADELHAQGCVLRLLERSLD